MHSAIAMAQFISPIGIIVLSADENHLISCRITTKGSAATVTGHPILAKALSQVQDWFLGKRQSFDVPLVPLTSPEGQALRTGIAAIPYGETLTYGSVAARTRPLPARWGKLAKPTPIPWSSPATASLQLRGLNFTQRATARAPKAGCLILNKTISPPTKGPD